MISSFRGEFQFLSNFHPCKVRHLSLDFVSSEHAYAASKTHDREVQIAISLLPTAGKAKRFYRKTQNLIRSDWCQIKIAIMTSIIEKKFSQNPDLAKMLTETGEEELVEGNVWNDKFWGQCPIGDGQNHLGNILMRVRFEIQEGIL